MKLKGVNLGNWLVLEKWMKPAMFEGTEAEDETYLCKALSKEEKCRRYQDHRNTYITKDDFEALAKDGFNAVRIPVPFFLFDDIEPFIHCYETLDHAFDWAEQAGLKILIDLHTVQGGHNGTDNSGLCGVCTWSTREEYLTQTLDVLEKIAVRYGKKPALYGIEALNEPMCSDTPVGSSMNIEKLSQIYHATDPELTKDNTNYPLSYLRDFYRSAYRRMKPHLGREKVIVFSDAFYPEGWHDFFMDPEFENIVLDTHQYLTMVEYGFGENRPFAAYREYLNHLAKLLDKVNTDITLIVGEWSLCNSMTGLDEAGDDEKSEMLRSLGQIYRDAVETCDGWFYWSYKLQTEEPGRDVWDARKCLEHRWLVL